MAELDSLDIQITASTHKAIDSINNLIGTLNKLSEAFNIKGIDGFVGSIDRLAGALDRINGDSLKSVSDALGKLSNSAKTLANIGSGAEQAGDGISKLAKEIANDFNITDNGAIQHLTEHIRELYRSTDQSSLSNSISAIQELIMKYSQFEKEMGGVNEEVMNFLKNTKIHLDNGWAKELRGDHKWIRATIGLLKTTKEGGLEAHAALKRMKELGADVELTPDNNDAMRAIAEWIRKQEEAQAKTLSFDQALKENIVTYRALDTALERIANSAGLTTERLGDMAMNGPNQETSAGFAQMAVMLERLEDVGNPFENIVIGLRELGDIQLSDSLNNINAIKDTISAIGNKSGRAAGESLMKIAQGMQALSGTDVPEFGNDMAVFTQQMRSLGSKTIVNASTSLTGIANGLNALKSVGSVPQIGGITELAQSLSLFGRKTAKEAATVIPQLSVAFRGLIDNLSKAPLVSQNVIDLANAMANLAGNTKAVAPASRKASSGIDLFSKKAKHAQKSTFSLAAAIGKLYATYWALFRVIGWFGKSIDIASDLTETQNVVDHVFGQMKYRMEDFSKTAVETVGMSELTAKKIGSRFQSMGKNMGITDAAIKRSDEFVQKVTGDYLKASDSVADMSINLTKLAGDMASFYNVDYESVAEDMEAVYTGMTRPLRKYGLDLTVATLKEWALANGLNADIKNMTQAEKTMLRYQYVMANTTAAQGDFENTINTWANQTRVAGENLKKLQIILGQIGIYSFKPLVQSFNVAMNDILHLAESTFNSLGTIFGWQIEISDVGIIDDLADGLEDVEDGYDDAGKEAKKFKNFLLGIDELNLLPDDKDKNKGAGDGAGLGAAASGIQDSLVDMQKTEKGFDSIYDTLYKLGARISEVQKEWYKGIDWDSVFDKAEKFGKGLASFLNGYLADAEMFYQKGRFIANGINTVGHAIYGFFHEFNGYQLGKDIGFEINGITRNLDWGIIQKATYEVAHDITEFINGVIENTNWKDVGRTIAQGLNTAILFVSTFWNEIHWDQLGVAAGDVINSFFLNWDEEEAARMVKGKLQAVLDFANSLLTTADFKMIGEKIGKFLSELQLTDYIDDIALLIKNLIQAAFIALAEIAEEAPIEAALITAYGLMKFGGLSVIGGNMATGVMTGFIPKLLTIMNADLGTVALSGSLLSRAGYIGLAIGGAILAAIGGMNLGIEIGKRIFPDDEMWYDEFENDLKEYFTYRFNLGSAKITGSDKEITGHSKRERTRYDISNGKDISEMYSQQRFGQWKQEQNNAARQAAREHEETVGRVLAGNQRIQLAIQSGVMTVKEATEAYDNMNHATVSVRKNTQTTFSSVASTASALANLASETTKTTDATNNLYKVIGGSNASLAGGASNINNINRHIEYLHTNLLTSKTGMDALNNAFEIMGNKKDKAGSISSAFDKSKEKIVEIGNLFTPDKMSTMFSAIPNAFRMAWTDTINIMKQMWAELAQWINTNAKIEIPKTKIGKNEFGGGTIQLRIPKFDVGGSIPNDGSLFFANENGPEVMANMGARTGIMNTDQMEAAIANGMAKALAANGQNVTVVLEGDTASLFTAMVKENDNAIRRTNSSPLRR